MVLDAVCTHATSLAASRYSAVKLTTDSYQFWVSHLNLRVTYGLHEKFKNMLMRFQSPLVYYRIDYTIRIDYAIKNMYM